MEANQIVFNASLDMSEPVSNPFVGMSSHFYLVKIKPKISRPF